MKLLLISRYFPNTFGGVSDYTYHLSKALAEKRMEVYVLTSMDKSINLQKEMKVLPLIKDWGFTGIGRLILETLKVHPDKILFQYVPYMYNNKYGIPIHLIFYVFFIKMVGKIPITLVCHELFIINGSGKYRIISFLQRNILKALSTFSEYIVVTTNRRKQFLERHGIADKKIHVIRAGSNIPSFPKSNVLNNKELSYFKFVVFGSPDIKRRRLDLVCEAIKHLSIKYKETCFKLLLIGPINDNTRNYLEKFMSSNVFFDIQILGILLPQEISKLLYSADVCISFDTSGLGGISSRSGSCAAALAFGLPLVGNRGADTDDIFQDKINVMFSEVDLKELKEKLDVLFSNKDLRFNLRKGAAELFEREFSWQTISQSFIELFCNNTKTSGI